MRVILSFLIISLSVGFAYAGNFTVYKWTDKDGVVHFTETPPSENAETKIIDMYNKPSRRDSTGSDRCKDLEDRGYSIEIVTNCYKSETKFLLERAMSLDPARSPYYIYKINELNRR